MIGSRTVAFLRGKTLGFLSKLNGVFDATLDIAAFLAVLLILFLMLGIIAEITVRGLGGTVLWIFEVTEYSLLFITFLGAAWLLRSEGHISMDSVLRWLNPSTQALLNIITSCIGIVICLALTLYGAKETWFYFQMGYTVESALLPPKAPLAAVIPVGSFLLFIQFLRRSYGYLRSWTMLRSREQGF